MKSDKFGQWPKKANVSSDCKRPGSLRDGANSKRSLDRRKMMCEARLNTVTRGIFQMP